VSARTRTEAVVNSATDAIVVFASDGLSISSLNPATSRLFGYPEEALIGAPLEILLTLEDRGDDQSKSGLLQRLLPESGAIARCETVGQRSDGSTLPIEITLAESKTDAGSFFVGTLRDISDRRQAEEAQQQLHDNLENMVTERTQELLHEVVERQQAENMLRDSEALIRIVLDNLPTAICLKDIDGRYRLVNKPYEAWYGFKIEDMLGKTVFDLFAAPEAAAYSSCDALVLAGSGVIDQEFEITFADGTIHQVIVTKFPVFGSDGQPVGMGTIDTDITSQKKIETELRQAQKMEAVGRLTGGIAHDFNNQLAVILGNLVMLEEDLADNDAHRDQIQHALDAANRGASLTHRLLAFSRNQVLAPQPTDVNELVKHLVELVRCTLGEAISVETIYADGLWQTLVDPYQLENAILNLTINARDAMPRGGKLSIEMSNTWLDEQAAVQAEVNPGEFVLLTVADGGMGIPAGVIDHVFEPFFTTKEVGQGSGLGLSMIYGFVKQSGGHISVESQIGTGATFKIYLPRSHQG